MKIKMFVFLFFIFAFSQLLIAQEKEKTDFSFSIAAPFNFNVVTIPKNDASGEYLYPELIEWGINLSLMFFKNSNFGYYINIYTIFYNRQIPNYNSVDNSIDKLDVMDSHLGIIPGIGYKQAINNYLSFFIGIGPEIRMSGIAFNERETLPQIGIGLGATLEVRLKIYKNLSFAGGVLISSNFFDKTNRNLAANPYIGFAWN